MSGASLQLAQPLRQRVLSRLACKPVTSEDGLYCLACGQRAPSIEHMPGHLMTSAHVRAVKAYLAK